MHPPAGEKNISPSFGQHSLDKSESYLLRSPEVCDRLQALLDQPEQMEMRLDRDQVFLRNFSRCELDFLYTEELGGYDPGYGINTSEFRVAANFRQMFSSFLPRFHAILVHSSGLIRNGKAALFVALSSGGKTTVVEHSTDGLILSDDQVVLRKESNVVKAHGTPFGRITGGPCSARLGGIFLLEKAEHFELSSLQSVDMLEYIWATLPSYTFFLPNSLRIQAFQILYDACHQVPVYRMRFPKDYVDWDAIDAAMAR